MLTFIVFDDFLYDKISSIEGCVCVRGKGGGQGVEFSLRNGLRG